MSKSLTSLSRKNRNYFQLQLHLVAAVVPTETQSFPFSTLPFLLTHDQPLCLLLEDTGSSLTAFPKDAAVRPQRVIIHLFCFNLYRECLREGTI